MINRKHYFKYRDISQLKDIDSYLKESYCSTVLIRFTGKVNMRRNLIRIEKSVPKLMSYKGPEKQEKKYKIGYRSTVYVMGQRIKQNK